MFLKIPKIILVSTSFLSLLLGAYLVSPKGATNVNTLEDGRCPSVYTDSERIVKCEEFPDKHFSSIAIVRSKSKLDVKVTGAIQLRRKWPLYTGFTGLVASYYLDDRLFIDTGAELSFLFVEGEVNEGVEQEFVGAFGTKKTYLLGKKELNSPQFEVKNINTISNIDANPFLKYSKFKGYLGLDFFIALKTVCFGLESGLITSNCFGTPDVIGNIIVPENKAVYTKVEYKGKSLYALLDSGFGLTTFYSPKCKDKEYGQISDAFGNIAEIGGELLIESLKFENFIINNVTIFCQKTQSENERLIIGSSFFAQNLSFLELNFEDNTYSLRVKSN